MHSLKTLLAIAALALSPHGAVAQDSWYVNQFRPTVADTAPAPTRTAAPAAPMHGAARSAPKVELRAWRTVVLPARADSGVRVASIGPAIVPQQPSARPLTGYAHEMGGLASFYWQGQMTSSGERFNPQGMTAAHKTLPFGTRVRVTNVTNGKSTIVRINDRGPFKGGRVIDLSQAAATEIDMTGRGIVRVALEVVN